MSKPTDIRVRAAQLFFLPVKTRVPLKFGAETLNSVTCARVCLRVEDRQGRTALGWGETPLSVQWVWPSAFAHQARLRAMYQFSTALTGAWAAFEDWGHPLELGARFVDGLLPEMLRAFQEAAGLPESMPHLAALVCCSPFDLALHDAYGKLHGVPVYDTYNAHYMNESLAPRLESIRESGVSFQDRYPGDYLQPPPQSLPVWHLVGGLDWLTPEENDGSGPEDGYPLDLRAWIRRDGLKCLKIKLRGVDADWDYDRIVRVGRIAIEEGADWLSTDFNCTVRDPGYVNAILDRLLVEQPRIYGMILYVEQPFPYDLEAHPMDVRSVSARKPLFMDESAHDWRLVRYGRELGWSGVALKTCKTQTGALLSLCWAKAHGMTLMVQDLTNPMLAQIPHVQLAAHAGTIMGVECNAMQFYPEASTLEAAVHPGLYTRRNGLLDLSTLGGPGFGYAIEKIKRPLPESVVDAGSW
ncbi:MAG: mandelate racemase/muconate lactonizing enzyme family protein [Candidatus Hydrogenedentes bacterium]|nr:mandelate racemase/muconate lactonizing enzyme family protein [Candidatus Hydrogenedentota bacterium]